MIITRSMTYDSMVSSSLHPEKSGEKSYLLNILNALKAVMQAGG